MQLVCKWYASRRLEVIRNAQSLTGLGESWVGGRAEAVGHGVLRLVVQDCGRAFLTLASQAEWVMLSSAMHTQQQVLF